MNQTHPRWHPALGWLVTLLVPIVLIVGGVRLLMSPAFLRVEYRTPNFPPDPYGFTLSDRLYWSEVALDYLLGDEGVDFLEDLRFEDGTPVYNARELRHMVDVKVVVRWVLSTGLIGLLALVGLGGLAWRWNAVTPYQRALARGGWLTAILVGTVILFVLIAFGIFFVAFHNVFFQPGTWRFAYSDTLIRLFPERFWRDAFLVVGGFSAAVGLLLGFFLGRRERPRSAQDLDTGA